MIMVSPYIRKNTIINAPMSHTSFLKTMRRKFGLGSLSAREDHSPDSANAELFSPMLQRTDITDMPDICPPTIPPDDTDYSKAVLTKIADAILAEIKDLWCKLFPHLCPSTDRVKTVGEAADFIQHMIRGAKSDAALSVAFEGVDDEIDENDLERGLVAIAEKLKEQHPELK